MNLTPVQHLLRGYFFAFHINNLPMFTTFVNFAFDSVQNYYKKWVFSVNFTIKGVAVLRLLCYNACI